MSARKPKPAPPVAPASDPARLTWDERVALARDEYGRLPYGFFAFLRAHPAPRRALGDTTDYAAEAAG